MKQRRRELRRHYNERANDKARRAIKQWAIQLGEPIHDFIDFCNPSRYGDNLKVCSNYCCMNPRRNPWSKKRDRLTKQEKISLAELDEAKKVDWINRLKAQDAMEAAWDCEVLKLCDFC